MKPERRLFPFKFFCLLVIIVCSFLATISQAAGIKSVQRGTVTFTSGANRMAVTSPAFQPVDVSKTIVWGGIVHGGGRVSGANPNASRIAFDLESGTTLALERLGSPASTPIVEWQAVEFATGVSVQRGVRSFATNETTANMLVANVDLSKAFVLVSVAPNMTGQGNDERWTIRARLTGSNNLELFRADSGIAVDVYWQVIEMQGASVQRGLTTFPANVNAASANIPASIDPSKSFLIMSFAGGAGINGIETRYMVRGAITNGNTLTFNRVASSNNAVNLAWEVVTMNDGTTAQSGSRSTVAGSDTLLNQTIGSVDLSRSFVYLSVQGGASGATNSLDDVSWTGALTSQTNLRLQRGVGGSQGTVNWQVVQFVRPPTKLAITSVNGGSNPTAGTAFPITVQSQDDTGAAGSVLTDTGVSISLKTGTGVLGGTLTGTIAAGTSQVTISGVTYGKAESGVVLTATRTSGDALAPGDSAPFTVNPGAAAMLAFTTQPGSANSGSTIPGPPTIRVQDGFGNTVTSSTASITVAIGNNPSGGTLSGTTTKSATAGVASFNDLSINQAGNGYTLTASSASLTGATSSAFNISPLIPDLVVSSISNPPGSAVAGAGFNVTDTTANSGSGAAAASTTSYRLSIDNVITASDPLLTGTRSVPGLAAGANSSGTIAVTIPSNLSAGSYFLGACADETNVVSESNETNNCSASAATMAVIGAPSITSLSPISGPIGTSVTIAGANFGATQGSSTVKFNGTTATPTSWSATSIAAPVPTGTTTGPVVVTVGGSASNGVNFSVTIPISYVYDSLGRLIAVINPGGDTAIYNYDAVGNVLSIDRQSSSVTALIEFTPKSGPVGTTVTIHGTAFSTTPSQNTVTFNGTAGTVTSATGTSLVVTVPTGATSGLINVTSPAGSASSAVAFNVTGAVGVPTITNFAPSVGTAGTAVTITGTNFDATPTNQIVRFNGAITNVTSSTSTTINTTVPTGTGSGRISVQTPRGSVTSSADFFVPAPPFTAADVEFTGRTTIGGNLTVNITTPFKIALTVFDGAAGQWINVQMSNVTFADGKSNVTLLRPNGSALFSNSSVAQSGGSFSVQLSDSGSHGIQVNGTADATGGMSLNLSPGAPGGSSLNLSCNGSCMLTCSATNPSLTFTASGGKPPYTWSTTKGTITSSASNRGSATLTPPANTGGTQVAFSRYRWGTHYISPGCCNTIYAEDFDCNGNVILQNNNACYNTGSGNWIFGTCGGGCLTPTCNGTATKICVVDQANIGCSNCNVFVEGLPQPPGTNAPRANCTSQVDPACAKFQGCGNNFSCYTVPFNAKPHLDVGYLCDRRTQQMISSGCKPCGTEMNGAVVTVTDSLGNSAFKSIAVNTP